MRRREFITLLGSAAVAWPLAARAQRAGRTYRLGFLEPIPRDAPPIVAFLDELRSHGFIEGQNLAVDYRNFGPHPDLISQYAADLVKTNANVIRGGGGLAIRTLQQATKTIPIIGISDDMLAEGLVDSLARPSGNLTGVSILATELDGKRQEILAEAVPGLRKLAVLADADNARVAKLDALREAARARGIELSVQRIAKGDDISAAIEAAKASGATALNVLASPMLFDNRRLIIERAAALRLPAIYQWPEEAEQGGFAGYGPRFIRIVRELVAPQVIQLLNGVKVADIPVEQPSKFELVINLKAANALGLTVPESLLARADEVIE
jgi:putative tryptophan/tyrosine transport system substrate-binding protein